ncbi:ankyrin repeat domain-containing protein [Ralstonia nicotianae]|uniref:ankyrin repeat domain-containing protein n=1 Tax=Ralstonia pseudosolanacearum TaxID=1310165 RepID=UPI0005C6A6D8|nr:MULTISPECIES: ankyrin repeat domain-containing protein [Ralstonia]QKL53288.1 ankyrin repeat domain-containing protein [Ralstonia solanacearum]MDO3519405.1 ankyrin repeat domain-containing protein [Ralstonia pseudosolanacearum]MDO3543896.1 ankyrin repeat domain-containing protein [Ralstonia pseudosolanacearum]OAI72636.1 ankyrin [Ralstonia pseudosolanacearum]QKM24543.1 ankyrin repeat domain-containing protein [Ralstonia solanacearum]
MDFPRRHSLSPLRFLTPSRSPQTERTPGASPAPGNTPRRASGPLSGLTKGFNALFKADPEKAALRQAFSMAETGKAESLAGLLQSHPHLVMAVNANGTTLLASAAKRGHVETVRLLLDLPASGACINQANKRGETPLQRAVEAGHAGVVEVLVQHAGVDPNVVDPHRRPLLHIAVDKRNVDITRALLAHPGLDVNRLDLGGNTALHLATRKQSAPLLRVLLDHPTVDPNLLDGKKRATLALAIGKLSADAVRELAHHARVNVNLPDEQGLTPVWQVLNRLVRHLERGSFDGRHSARTRKELDCLSALARAPHIDLNALGPGGHTPLTRLACAETPRAMMPGLDTMLTVMEYHRYLGKAVKTILRESQGRNDFNPNARNIDGQAAIQVALRHGKDDLVTLLARDPRSDPGALVTRLIRAPIMLFELLNPDLEPPSTRSGSEVFLIEQLTKAIRFRNPDGTANPWISRALCEYVQRFELVKLDQPRPVRGAASCQLDAASYAAQALEYSLAFRQVPMIQRAAGQLIHHAPAHQMFFNVGGVEVSRDEVQAWGQGNLPDGIQNATLEEHVRGNVANVHVRGLLTRGHAMLAEMKERTPEGQQRPVGQTVAELRALIDQGRTQAKDALKATAGQEALEALEAMEALEALKELEEIVAEEAEEAQEEEAADEAEEAKAEEAKAAQAHTEMERQQSRLKERIADLRKAEKGIRHVLKMGPTTEDPDYAVRARAALSEIWSYMQSRPDDALKANLTNALLQRLTDIGKDVPCNTGCIQRMVYACEGVDTLLAGAEPDQEGMYGEILAIAKQVNDRCNALFADVESAGPEASGTSRALPMTWFDRQLIARYKAGADIDDDVVNEVKRDMVRATVLADLVERRGWTRAKVQAVLAPVLDNVAYLDALSSTASTSGNANKGRDASAGHDL